MNDQEKNAMIAKPMSADPDKTWGEWAHLEIRGWISIPRDFADPENTLKLITWAAAQTWWDKVALQIWDALRTLPGIGDGVPTLADVRVAREVADIIATRLKEIEDGAA